MVSIDYITNLSITSLYPHTLILRYLQTLLVVTPNDSVASNLQETKV